MLRLLPWEYGVRNLFRRPLRTALTFAVLATVVALVLAVAGFVRGLEKSLATSGNPRVALVYGLGMGENLEYSSIPARTSDLLAASLGGVQTWYGQKFVSPELYLGTQIGVEGMQPAMGLVRGVTPSALLVRRQMELLEGNWPGPGEVIVGRLVSAKLGAASEQLAIGQQITLEGRPWTIRGVFAAAGSVFESEVWCRLDDLQQAMKRQDLSLVALTMESADDFTNVNLFCKERLDLELQATREVDYYASLTKHYRPVRMLAWLVALLVSASGVFAGLNTMYGSVLGRIRELATLQAIGYRRAALVISLLQEGVLLAAASSLVACLPAFLLLHGAAVRFTMSAFTLEIDGLAVLIGCGTGLSLGVIGALPPALHALRLPVVEALRTV